MQQILLHIVAIKIKPENKNRPKYPFPFKEK